MHFNRPPVTFSSPPPSDGFSTPPRGTPNPLCSWCGDVIDRPRDVAWKPLDRNLGIDQWLPCSIFYRNEGCFWLAKCVRCVNAELRTQLDALSTELQEAKDALAIEPAARERNTRPQGDAALQEASTQDDNPQPRGSKSRKVVAVDQGAK